MRVKQPKKLIILNILDILRKYTDADHRLSQREIEEILRTEYDMEVDRKAVKRNLMDLIDFGYEIEYSESIRMVPDPKTGKMEESVICSDFYLEQDFTDAELRLLIDSLLFSRHLPFRQSRELIDKLQGLSNIYFHSRVRHIARMPEDRTANRQLFLNIELLDEAITRNRKVSFKYLDYGTDKVQRPKKHKDGTEEYIVSPYQMAAREGKYYLICNYDKYQDISNYRIDRICDLRILDERAKPFESLEWFGGRPLDMEDYMKKHVYMYSGGDRRVKFRIVRAMISDVIDLFGKDVTFSEETESTVCVTVYTNAPSAVQFAKSYAPDVILLEPRELAEEIKESMEKAIIMYK